MPTYHVELRDFPHNVNRFNLTGPELGAIALSWVQGHRVEVGGQEWNPEEATLMIVEGPEIPIGQLTMGRGWSKALREGEEVTQRVLAEARAALAGEAGSPAPGVQAPVGPASGADQLALGVELGGLLGAEPSRLLAAWRAVAGRSAGLTPSESLALAERELASGGPAA